ncbi:MAG: NAD(+) synthase [SAR324 cluster bacterium]|nr:NAD(+) synthase [SAR324 cluster bacterium]
MENGNILISLGFFRTAVVVPEVRVADVDFNAQVIHGAIEQAAKSDCQLVLFPELCLTGYSCADLFYQPLLLDHAQTALADLAATTAHCSLLAVVGVPILLDNRLYNCAAFLGNGKVLGMVPKTYLPNTGEFYEERWFTSAGHTLEKTIRIGNQTIPFGTTLIFRARNFPECSIGIEICEDLWAVQPPSGSAALAGATLILNLSASNELLGKASYRRDLIKQQSARCLAAYLYTSAGPGESTTDLVYSGHALIAENGIVIAESDRLRFETQIIMGDLDLQRVQNDRLKNNVFSSSQANQEYHSVWFEIPRKRVSLTTGRPKLLRSLSKRPFVPDDVSKRDEHCKEIFTLQSVALAKRLRHTGTNYVTLGLSGGLDSTLALLVANKTYDLLSMDRAGIIVITMPGFGTTSRTHGNAERLAKLLGNTFRCIPIHEAVRQHFEDIGHDESVHDVVYENAQARERTQILMDVANQVGGIVLGTGDLSELALGWCTYNADQMSMYNVNAGVPKTLVRYLVEWCAENEFSGDIAQVLHDIGDTPISPELLPLSEEGELQQKTESIIGPYEVHDFFLFYMVRHQFPPRKVFFLACQVFDYSQLELLRWLRVFYQRFFSQQFKRSAMPDGPKIGSVALSPRGDWRMPSDACAILWLNQITEMEKLYD